MCVNVCFWRFWGYICLYIKYIYIYLLHHVNVSQLESKSQFCLKVLVFFFIVRWIHCVGGYKMKREREKERCIYLYITYILDLSKLKRTCGFFSGWFGFYHKIFKRRMHTINNYMWNWQFKSERERKKKK